MSDINQRSHTFLRLPDVMAKTGLGRSSVWNLVKRNAFPKPINLGLKCTAWSLESIESWMQERIDASSKAGG